VGGLSDNPLKQIRRQKLKEQFYANPGMAIDLVDNARQVVTLFATACVSFIEQGGGYRSGWNTGLSVVCRLLTNGFASFARLGDLTNWEAR
jgi:hypothetical protein